LFLDRFNHSNLVIPERCYPTSIYSIPSSTAGLFQWLTKRPPGKSSSCLTSSCSNICSLSPPRLVVPVFVLLHTTFAALSHPLPFSNAFRPSITLNPTPMRQPNFSNAQVAPSSLAVLVLSNLLQDRTERYFFLIVHFLSPWFNDFCSGVVRCSAATAVKLVAHLELAAATSTYLHLDIHHTCSRY
jgi:hypothetical protein